MKKILKTSILFMVLILIFTFTFVGCTQNNKKNIKNQTENNITKDKIIDDEAKAKDSNKNNSNEIKSVIEQDHLIQITSSYVNLKSNASNYGYTVGQVNKNDLLPLNGYEGNYYKTKFNNQNAYIPIDNNIANLITIPKVSQDIENVLIQMKSAIGVPYIFGAQRIHWGNGTYNNSFSKNSFDCSSLVQYAFYKNGILLNTTSRSQSTQGKYVDSNNLQRGDVMFFTNSSRKYNTGIEKIGHVGIYFGNNYIIHTAYDYAIIEPISNTRWNYFIKAKRFI